MPRRLFNVSETFRLRGRGLVVVTDQTYETLDPTIKLRIGDSISIQRTGGESLITPIIGIEISDPWTPKRPFAFLLDENISDGDVPRGAEVWSVDR